ncbi:hypothetical protein E3N88_01013 [Mikania micrantha]|uniref:Uncharacterized protein n=1 Tax=Mikania micrantha TaxID=192012 RepID=A0A5N6Q175_9ASTR|nr:hypothetical protein E3N88_01013 [Mikania micrantha]
MDQQTFSREEEETGASVEEDESSLEKICDCDLPLCAATVVLFGVLRLPIAVARRTATLCRPPDDCSAGLSGCSVLTFPVVPLRT